MTEPLRPAECPTCRETGRRGYCAPLRCYCLHPSCPAFAVDPVAVERAGVDEAPVAIANARAALRARQGGRRKRTT